MDAKVATEAGNEAEREAETTLRDSERARCLASSASWEGSHFFSYISTALEMVHINYGVAAEREEEKEGGAVRLRVIEP